MKKQQQELDNIIKEIKKEFGEGVIMKLGEKSTNNIQAIPTGCLSLDSALGIGGVPRGRIIEIYGLEGSGKTTLACYIIAEAQKMGGNAAFIDAEYGLDSDYIKKLGVKLDKLYVSQPNSGEEALRILEKLVNSGKVDVIVLDSVAALVPQAEIEGEIGELRIGLQARLMSATLRKLVGVISKTNTCVIFLNQIRMKIGILWGNPETTSGGLALKFYSSVRLELRKSKSITSEKEIIGNRIVAKIVKSKVSPPFKKAEFSIYYGEGISLIDDLIDISVLNEIMKKSGPWLYYKDEKWQGREEAKKFLKENPKVIEEIRKIVLENKKE